MAKGAKKGAKAPKRAKAAKPEAAKSSDVRKMPSANKIKELARNLNHAKESIGEIAGSVGSQMRTASENNGVHTGALKDVVKNMRKEPGRLAEFLDHRDYCEEVLGMREKAASAPRLPLDEEEETEETEAEPEQGNVEPFPQPKAVAAE